MWCGSQEVGNRGCWLCSTWSNGAARALSGTLVVGVCCQVRPPAKRQLEGEVRRGLERDRRRWSTWTRAAPLVALIMLIVAGQVVAHLVTLHAQVRVVTAGATSILADLNLAEVVWLCARGPAARGGGWAASFGAY